MFAKSVAILFISLAGSSMASPAKLFARQSAPVCETPERAPFLSNCITAINTAQQSTCQPGFNSILLNSAQTCNLVIESDNGQALCQDLTAIKAAANTIVDNCQFELDFGETRVAGSAEISPGQRVVLTASLCPDFC